MGLLLLLHFAPSSCKQLCCRRSYLVGGAAQVVSPHHHGAAAAHLHRQQQCRAGEQAAVQAGNAQPSTLLIASRWGGSAQRRWRRSSLQPLHPIALGPLPAPIGAPATCAELRVSCCGARAGIEPAVACEAWGGWGLASRRWLLLRPPDRMQVGCVLTRAVRAAGRARVHRVDTACMVLASAVLVLVLGGTRVAGHRGGPGPPLRARDHTGKLAFCMGPARGAQPSLVPIFGQLIAGRIYREWRPRERRCKGNCWSWCPVRLPLGAGGRPKLLALRENSDKIGRWRSKLETAAAAAAHPPPTRRCRATPHPLFFPGMEELQQRRAELMRVSQDLAALQRRLAQLDASLERKRVRDGCGGGAAATGRTWQRPCSSAVHLQRAGCPPDLATAQVRCLMFAVLL